MILQIIATVRRDNVIAWRHHVGLNATIHRWTYGRKRDTATRFALPIVLPLTVKIDDSVTMSGSANADDTWSAGWRHNIMGWFASTERRIDSVCSPFAIDSPTGNFFLVIEHFDGEWNICTYLLLCRVEHKVVAGLKAIVAVRISLNNNGIETRNNVTAKYEV